MILLVMGWNQKKTETLACGQDGRRPLEFRVAIARRLEPEMEVNMLNVRSILKITL